MDDAVARTLALLDGMESPAACLFDGAPGLSGTVAVLPSAYNPPTVAHRHLLESAGSAVPSSSALALLTTRNVDKGLHGAPLADRVGMLLALAGESPGLAVGASNRARIIDQAESLVASFGPLELVFVVGFDTLERLFAPRYYQDMERELAPFFERHRVLAANRGSIGAAQVADWVSANANPFHDRIGVLEIDEFPASLSSTQVREALAAGNHHSALTPAVRRYIEQHGLYR